MELYTPLSHKNHFDFLQLSLLIFLKVRGWKVFGLVPAGFQTDALSSCAARCSVPVSSEKVKRLPVQVQ